MYMAENQILVEQRASIRLTYSSCCVSTVKPGKKPGRKLQRHENVCERGRSRRRGGFSSTTFLRSVELKCNGHKIVILD